MSTLERLRASDPARALDPTPPEDLLRAIVSTPATAAAAPPRRARARPRDRRGGRGAPARPHRLHRPRRPRLRPDRARERLDPLRPHHHAPADGAGRPHRARRDLAARALAAGRALALDPAPPGRGVSWRSAARTASCTSPDGTTARREDGGDAKDYIDRSEPGFLNDFRKAYESGRLDESGDARFAGRAAKRYIVTERDNVSEYYLDAETGMPLGSRQRMVTYAPKIGPDRRPTLGEADRVPGDHRDRQGARAAPIHAREPRQAHGTRKLKRPILVPPGSSACSR